MGRRLTARNPRGIAALAGLCLALQLAVWSPLLPLATALAAWWDGDHTVCFVARPGEVRLELRHIRGAGLLVEGHHHRATTRALVIFSEPASPSDPDHVLEFASSQPYSRDHRASLRSPTLAEEAWLSSNAGAPSVALPGGDAALAGVLPRREFQRRDLSPATAAGAASSATVVLLI